MASRTLLSSFLYFLVFSINLQASCHTPAATPRKQGTESFFSYIAPETLFTDRLILKRVRSAQQEIDCYEALYQDGGDSSNWFTGFPWNEPCHGRLFAQNKGLSRPEKHVQDLKKAEEIGYYRLPLSFRDYTIHLAETDKLIGRFHFCEVEKRKDRLENRLEIGLYLIQSARRQGFGLEVKGVIFERVIKPALGKAYMVLSATLEETFLSKKREDISLRDFRPELYSHFKGVFAKCAPWYNVGSLALSHKVGCGIRWLSLTPFSYYPCLKTPSLEAENVLSLKNLLSCFAQFRDLLTEVAAYQEKESGKISDLALQMFRLIKNYEAGGYKLIFFDNDDAGVLIQHMRTWDDLFRLEKLYEYTPSIGDEDDESDTINCNEFEGFLTEIKTHAQDLLKTNEPHTFLSALEMLTYFSKDLSAFKAQISPSKAFHILEALEKTVSQGSKDAPLLCEYRPFLEKIISEALMPPRRKRQDAEASDANGFLEKSDSVHRASKQLKTADKIRQ